MNDRGPFYPDDDKEPLAQLQDHYYRAWLSHVAAGGDDLIASANSIAVIGTTNYEGFKQGIRELFELVTTCGLFTKGKISADRMWLKFRKDDMDDLIESLGGERWSTDDLLYVRWRGPFDKVEFFDTGPKKARRAAAIKVPNVEEGGTMVIDCDRQLKDIDFEDIYDTKQHFHLVLNNGTRAICRPASDKNCDCEIGPVISITAHDVERIHDSALARADHLERVDMPSLRHIGRCGYSYCSSLKEIDLPSLVSLGTNAFRNCGSLEGFRIPETLKIMGSTPFDGCKALRRIDVDERNEHFRSEDGVLSTRRRAELTIYRRDDGEIVFKGSDRSFSKISLRDADALITYPPARPDKIVSCNADVIAERAFCEAVNIEELRLGKAQYICREAFGGMRSLKRLYLPDTLQEVSRHAFHDLTVNGLAELESIEMPRRSGRYLTRDGVLISHRNGIEEEIVRCPSKATGTFFSAHATTAAPDAFYYCKGLEQIILPNVESIGAFTFSGCESLVYLALPKLKHIDTAGSCHRAIEELPHLSVLRLPDEPNARTSSIIPYWVPDGLIILVSNKDAWRHTRNGVGSKTAAQKRFDFIECPSDTPVKITQLRPNAYAIQIGDLLSTMRSFE